MRIKFLFSVLFSLVVLGSFSTQGSVSASFDGYSVNYNRTIQFLVTDSVDNEPIVGASIAIKGTNIGTTTDDQGVGYLTVDVGVDVVIVSYVGYSTWEGRITNTGTKEVKLLPN